MKNQEFIEKLGELDEVSAALVGDYIESVQHTARLLFVEFVKTTDPRLELEAAKRAFDLAQAFHTVERRFQETLIAEMTGG